MRDNNRPRPFPLSEKQYEEIDRFKAFLGVVTYEGTNFQYHMVLLSHQELNGLIGQLLQMCDLMTDPEQRKATKDTVKRICRAWMDDCYRSIGFDLPHGRTLYEDVPLTPFGMSKSFVDKVAAQHHTATAVRKAVKQ